VTEYESKSLKRLSDINVKLGLLVTAAGLTVPTDPPKPPMKISQHVINRARQTAQRQSGGGWMGR